MTCSITILAVGASGNTAIQVEGTLEGQCRRLSVSAVLEDGTSFATEIDTPGEGPRDWEATLDGLEPGVLAAVCQQGGSVTVTVACAAGGDCTEEATLPLICCPDVSLVSLGFGADCTQFGGTGFKTITTEIAVTWTAGFNEVLQIKLVLTPTGFPDPPEFSAVINATPGQSTYTEADFVGGALSVIAGQSYEVTLATVLPVRCAEGVVIDAFAAAACDCPALPDDAELFEILDAAGAPIPDIHVQCIDGETVTVHPTVQPTGWAAAGALPAAALAVVADQSEATVTLPPDGSIATILVDFGEGSCRETRSVSMRRCVDAPPPDEEDVPPPNGDNGDPDNGGGDGDDDDDDDETEDPIRPPVVAAPPICAVLSVLLLIGVAIASVGFVLAACPLVAAPLLPAQFAFAVGVVLLLAGLAIIALILLMKWALGCPFGRCTWLKWGWQAAFILGAVMIYAGFCPACSWMLVGILLWFVALWLFLWWRRACRPTICGVYAELLFALIAFDIAAVLEIGLAACVITTSWPLALAWAVFVIVANIYVIRGLRANNCLVS